MTSQEAIIKSLFDRIKEIVNVEEFNYIKLQELAHLTKELTALQLNFTFPPVEKVLNHFFPRSAQISTAVAGQVVDEVIKRVKADITQRLTEDDNSPNRPHGESLCQQAPRICSRCKSDNARQSPAAI